MAAASGGSGDAADAAGEAAAMGPAAPSHWDIFYSHPSKPDVAEYMLPFSRLAPYLEPAFLRIAAEEARFLVVGCGLSALGEELHDALGGRLREIMNVDISTYSVEHLRARNLHRPRMRFAVEDMTRSSLPPQSYEVIVDKGVLDDVLAFTRCGSDGLPSREEPPDAGERAACGYLWELRRVLVARGGVYVCASVHGRDRLAPLLCSALLGFAEVEYFELTGGPVVHHLHVCRSRDGHEAEPCKFDAFVEDVLHNKYTEVMPWLTAERAMGVRGLFQPPRDLDRSSGVASRPAGELYLEAFTCEERAEYPLDDFLGDLSCFLTRRAPAAAADAVHLSGSGDAPAAADQDTSLSCDMFIDFLKDAQ